MPQALWGFGHGRELEAGRFARAVRVEREYNLNVTARILLMGNSRFVPSMISTSCAWQESAIGNFCVMNCPITFG